MCLRIEHDFLWQSHSGQAAIDTNARQRLTLVFLFRQDDIAALPAATTAGFLRVDARPLKQALATWVTKWIYLFTQYLQTKVCTPCRLANLFG